MKDWPAVVLPLEMHGDGERWNSRIQLPPGILSSRLYTSRWKCIAMHARFTAWTVDALQLTLGLHRTMKDWPAVYIVQLPLGMHGDGQRWNSRTRTSARNFIVTVEHWPTVVELPLELHRHGLRLNSRCTPTYAWIASPSRRRIVRPRSRTFAGKASSWRVGESHSNSR